MDFNLWLRIIRTNYGIVAGAVDWITVKLSANEEARDDQEQKGAVPRLAESAGRLKLKKKTGEKKRARDRSGDW